MATSRKSEYKLVRVDDKSVSEDGQNIAESEKVPWSAELYTILQLGWPNSIAYISSLLPGMLMLVFLGKLEDGDQLIAAGGMGFMFGNITGFSIIIGSYACVLVSSSIQKQTM